MIVPQRKDEILPGPAEAQEMQKALETARLLMRRCVENKAINGLFGEVGHWKRFRDEAAGRGVYEELPLSTHLLMTAMLIHETASKLTPAARPKERLSKAEYRQRMDLERIKADWKNKLACAAHEMLLTHFQPEQAAVRKDSCRALFESARKWRDELQRGKNGRKSGPQQPLVFS